MTWGNRYRRGPEAITPADRIEAARLAEQAADQRRREMAGREKSVTGILRAQLRTDEAKRAVGSLNRKMDEAVDEIRQAFQREALAADTKGMVREDDARRAPVLDGRKGVR